MPSTSIVKFRCFRCSRLLGVGRSKVGSLVNCPKCGAELIVPELDELGSQPEGNPPTSDASPSSPGSSSVTPLFELLDIRPEDIRVEPGIVWTPPSEGPAPSPSFEGLPETPEGSPSAELAGDPETATDPALTAAPVGVASHPAEAGDAVVPVKTVAPEIPLNGGRVAADRTTILRSRDLVLPRSAVALWSLFVLVAQALAFVAGLLAGHYVWRIH